MYYNQKDLDEATINLIWEKAAYISGSGEDEIRKDVAGAMIRRGSYGYTGTKLNMGWEVDHRKPLSKNGSNDLSNLRPLHWANNRSKDDDYPKWKSVVTSNGYENIIKEQWWIAE